MRHRNKWKFSIAVLALLTIVTGFLWTRPLDLRLVGAMHLKQTVNANTSHPIYVTWDFPADEVREAFKYLKPCSWEYRYAMISGAHKGTLQYGNREFDVSCMHVKQSNTVVIIAFRGHKYMLIKPDSDRFYEMIGSHEKRQMT